MKTITWVGLAAVAFGGLVGYQKWREYNEPWKPSDVSTEGGVKVVKAPSDAWCTAIGNCFENRADCDRADKGTCTRHENFACLTFTTRTDNSKMLECWKTYGECKTRQSAVERNPELKAIETPCVIFRKDG